MSDMIEVEITQSPDFEAKTDALRKAVEKAVKAHAHLMRDYAAGIAPVRTGRLKDSITSRTESEGSEISAIVGTNLEYAPYVEYGTGRGGDAFGGATYDGHTDESISYTEDWEGMLAQPYLRPALYDLEGTFRDSIERAVREALK